MNDIQFENKDATRANFFSFATTMRYLTAKAVTLTFTPYYPFNPSRHANQTTTKYLYISLHFLFYLIYIIFCNFMRIATSTQFFLNIERLHNNMTITIRLNIYS